MDEFPSIEKLAAYFDGNLPRDEMLQISKMADEDGLLHQLMDDYSQTEDTEATYLEQNFHLPDDIVGEDFSIPDIDNLEKISPVDDSFWNNEGLYYQERINADELNQVSETLKNNNMTTNYRTYGETGENILHPGFQQPDNHSCGLESQRIILRDYGIDIPFADLEQFAKEAGIYSDQGTRTIDLGEVLEMAGVGVHKIQGANIYDLINEFAQGHRVIVSLDADELWHNNTMSEKLSNWMHDVFGGQGGNHALVVAGVEVNPNDTNDIKIVLTDPGAGHLRIEYPFGQFANAWRDSNCFMVATNEAAPYQYDSEKDMYVPSNFFSEYIYNQFVKENSFQLDSDRINHPWSYEPTFKGHIDTIGQLSYDDFFGQLNSGVIDFNSVMGATSEPFDYGNIKQCRFFSDEGLYSESNQMNNSDWSNAEQNPSKSGELGGFDNGFEGFGMGSDYLDKGSESTGIVESSIIEKGESSGSVGSDYLDKSSESTGSVGSSILEKGESTGSVGSDYLDKSSESTGSVGAGLPGYNTESMDYNWDSMLGDGGESTGGCG